jgi:hypothetical protein
MSIYSQTGVQRPPLGPGKSGRYSEGQTVNYLFLLKLISLSKYRAEL